MIMFQSNLNVQFFHNILHFLTTHLLYINQQKALNLLEMNSRMGCAFWTVAVILERLSITSRSSLIMESLISSTQRVRALTHSGPAQRLTTPISRHLITCNVSIVFFSDTMTTIYTLLSGLWKHERSITLIYLK